MLKAFKFRLYPTKDQIVKLNQHFGHTRFVYNYFFDYSQKQYKAGNKTNYCDWAGILTELKRTEDRLWLKDVNSQALQQSLKDLQTSYINLRNSDWKVLRGCSCRNGRTACHKNHKPSESNRNRRVTEKLRHPVRRNEDPSSKSFVKI